MKIVFFDLETSGLDSTQHEIIQIGACAVDTDAGWCIVDTFERKLQFRLATADSRALELAHYDPTIWANEAVDPRIAVREFTNFLQQYSCIGKIAKDGHPYCIAQLAGYNVSYDMKFLIQLYKDMGMFLPAEFIGLDTLQLAEWYFVLPPKPPTRPRNFKLSTLCDYFNVDLADAHDALADTVATVQVTKEIILRSKKV